MITLEAPGAVRRFATSEKDCGSRENQALLHSGAQVFKSKRIRNSPEVRSPADGRVIVDARTTEYTLYRVILKPEQVLQVEREDEPLARAFKQKYPGYRIAYDL